jgi:hypothetical protein
MKAASCLRPFPAALACAALFALGACQSSSGGSGTDGHKRMLALNTAVTECREAAEKVKSSTHTALETLGNLLAQANPESKTMFGAFSDQVKGAEKSADGFSDAFDDLRSDANDHFGTWQEENSSIEDFDIRRQADERRSATLDAYGKCERQAVKVVERSKPALAKFKDLRKYLNNDQTAAGIASAAGFAKPLEELNGELTQAIDALVAELDELTPLIAPSAAPSAAAKPAEKSSDKK